MCLLRRFFIATQYDLSLTFVQNICKYIDMSTKTVAIKNDVYQKLTQEKREEESFTKTIDRLLGYQQTKTCASAVREAAKLWGDVAHADDEADVMETGIAAGRCGTDWSVERPQ